MIFHLTGIKEKNKTQHQLNFLIEGNSGESIKQFLSRNGIIVIGLTEYTDTPDMFGNLRIEIASKMENFTIYLQDESLEEGIYSSLYLGFNVINANYLSKQIPDQEAKNIIAKTQVTIHDKENEYKVIEAEKREKEAAIYKNPKIKKALEVIDDTIAQIQQLQAIGSMYLNMEQKKTLEEISNTLKKIKLGTNYNKMVELLERSQDYILKTEEDILQKLDDKKFLIDRNSEIANTDVISEEAKLMKAKNNAKLKKTPTQEEGAYVALGKRNVFRKFLTKDLIISLQNTGEDVFQCIRLIEIVIIMIIVEITLLRLRSDISLAKTDDSALSRLVALGIGGICAYIGTLIKNRKTSTLLLRIIGLVILFFALFLLIKNTFAF